MSNQEIKPCPFCGSKPEFPESKDVYGTCYDAGCNDCCLATISIQIIDCFDYPRDDVHDSWNPDTYQYGVDYIDMVRDGAIEQWNTRTTPENRGES